MNNPVRLRPLSYGGKAYYDELRAILKAEGPAIIAEVKQAKERRGKITAVDVVRVALAHSLNLKATFEWLEESHVLPTGTYEKIREGHKVKDLIAAAMTEAEELKA